MIIKSAAIQFAPIYKDYSANIKKIEILISQANEKNIKLVVLPEMCTTGYIFDNRESIQDFVETIPGKSTGLIEDLAKKYNMYIVIGIAEKDENEIYYNSAALIGPFGFIGKYRKIHQFIADPLWAADGDMGLNVFDTEIGKIGIAICMDLNIEETCAVLSRKGSNVICVPSNWFGEKLPSPVWITRAYEHACPIIIANRTGNEKKTFFGGMSSVINHHGEILDSIIEDEGIAIGDIEIFEREKVRKYSFFKEMSRHTFSWNPIWFFRQTQGKLPAGDDFQVTSVQIKHSDLDVFSENKKLIKRLTVDELNSNSKLILFPENILNGLDKYVPYEKIVEFSKEISFVLGNYNAFLVVSGIVNNKEKISSTIFLLSKDGIIGEYKKIYSLDTYINDFGINPVFIDTELGRIGLMFGNELKNMEISRVLAINSVDLICIPDCDGREYNKEYNDGEILWSLAKVRARENNLYTMYSNYVGGNSIGFTGVFGPNAFERDDDFEYKVLGEGSVKMMIYLNEKSRLFPSNRIKYKPLMHFRKPQFYKDLF